MKRLRYNLIFCAVILLLFISTKIDVSAKEKEISSISIEVALDEEGNADITEVWDVKGISSGTEYYKPYYDVGDKVIKDLAVTDESGVKYTYNDSWDVDASLEDKAYTCGILKTEEGYEICWGMSSYGDHTYEINYTITGMVQSYSDYAGLRFQFLPSEMSSPPVTAELVIYMENQSFTESNTGIWSFGYTGNIEFTNAGEIYAYSTEELERNSIISIMCRFDNTLFPDAGAVSGDFQSIIDETLEAEDDSISLPVLLTLIGIFVLIIVVIIIVVNESMKIHLSDGTVMRRPNKKEVSVRNTPPFNGNIPACVFGLRQLGTVVGSGALISAYLIKWEMDKTIQIDERGLDKKGKKKGAFIFPDYVPEYSGSEENLFQYLQSIADNEGIVTSKMLKKWGEKNLDRVKYWEKNVAEEGEKEAVAMGYMSQNKKGKLLFNNSGYAQLEHLTGYEKYLRSFKEYYGQTAGERELWGEYLIFSVLLGFGKELTGSFKSADLHYYNEFETAFGFDGFSLFYLLYMTDSYSQAVSVNTDGTGGAAMAGGGGFSGGASGGGSR